MRLVDDTTEKTGAALKENQSGVASQAQIVDVAISMMSNIVETACERSADLDLMRLVNFMDLYSVYLQLANKPESELHQRLESITGPLDSVITQTLGDTEMVSFERFVRDSRLLSVAAIGASLESGERVLPPLPLNISAND